MEQREVYFLKMNSGEDLLCTLIEQDEYSLYVTQPYRVEIMQTPATMTMTTAIMRWIPFESLMVQKISIEKKHVLTYMPVDDIVAVKYRNTIEAQAQREMESQQDRLKKFLEQLEKITEHNSNTHITGTIH